MVLIYPILIKFELKNWTLYTQFAQVHIYTEIIMINIIGVQMASFPIGTENINIINYINDDSKNLIFVILHLNRN